ncbi:hypothetical protein GCM10007860_28310 [Chitiniphilus shinanonensis]|uniref:Uncharacterized protein n=1 Tax=Chitiniphilus shinanonensis TaxID=553088 RepID=A0ABQ6BVZ8_9NEIS|nr:hypothetical protein [Chitiniphilus shinanonensis]GLS05674.1 hypothetical protein GCM10007860_28310 [Chitiniphilus shinanonensis]
MDIHLHPAIQAATTQGQAEPLPPDLSQHEEPGTVGATLGTVWGAWVGCVLGTAVVGSVYGSSRIAR